MLVRRDGRRQRLGVWESDQRSFSRSLVVSATLISIRWYEQSVPRARRMIARANAKAAGRRTAGEEMSEGDRGTWTRRTRLMPVAMATATMDAPLTNQRK